MGQFRQYENVAGAESILARCIAYLKAHWKWIAFAFGCLVFLYAVYFAFAFRTQPIYSSPSKSYWGVRNILFRVFCGLIDLGVVVWGVWLYAKGKLDARKACVLLSFIAMATAMCYSFATPIWDYGMHWNQHDDYYANVSGQYAMADGVLDGGSGHFGMIMTCFRTWRVPEIKLANGAYDFSFSAVGERYQPKTFYFATALFMKWNSLFIKGAEGNVNINGYAMTNTEWTLFECNRILWTAMVWLAYYYVYKTLKAMGLKGKGLVAAYALVAFCPMFFFFANWDNNDGMSAFFAFAAFYRGIRFVRERDWKNCLLCAMDIGLSMSCKLGGAIVALAIIPMLVYVAVDSIKKAKGTGFNLQNPFIRLLLQGFCFALIVFPIGLAWPIYSKVRFGQDIFFFSDAKNQRLLMRMPLLKACFLWPNEETFTSIFVYHYDSSLAQIQDYSLTSNVLKKTLYNEYHWANSYWQLSVLYVSAVLLTFYVLLMISVRIVFAVIHKRKDWDYPRAIGVASLLIANWGWAVWFVYKSPYTCNCDIRYIPTFVLGFGALLGTHCESSVRLSNPRLAKLSQAIPLCLIAFLVASCVAAYTSVCAWNSVLYL